MTTGYAWGHTSKRRMRGVNERLVAVATLALTKYATVDFGVAWMGGKRTAKQQLAMYESGASTLDGTDRISFHQSGDALDLLPWVKGLGFRFETQLVMNVANAMRRAANETGERIRWGGSWTFLNRRSAEAEYRKYVARKIAQGKNPFFDGGHFEIH